MQLRTAIADIETDGLLDVLTRVHCLSVREYESGRKFRFRKNKKWDNIEEGLDLLENADRVVFHNGLPFDIPAIEKCYPGFEIRGTVSDSLVLSRLVLPEIESNDYRLFDAGKLPGNLIGRHGLEAWGYRLGLHKGDYAKDMEEKAKAKGITDEQEIIKFVWGKWNPAMDDYCELDTGVTGQLWGRILEKLENWSYDSVILEHQAADLMVRLEHNGFPFNIPAARTLVNEMTELREPIREECGERFPGRFVPDKKYEGPPREEYGEKKFRSWVNRGRWWAEVTIPKRTLNYKDVTKASRIEGVPYCKIKWKEFNPGSRPQVSERLTELGWKPDEFTDNDNPVVNDSTLRRAADQIPIAKSLADYFLIQKRLGQIAEGDEAWLTTVGDDGKIHGSINPHGAVTGRGSHFNPNIAQVPKVVTKKGVGIIKGFEGGWGYECRDLFYAPPPFILLGADLSGIELRCLAHYMAEFDDGEYGKELLEGDIHSVNQEAAGLESRDMAKTFIYAFLYGAGDAKIGSIVDPLADKEAQARIGKTLKARFLARLPALKRLVKKVKREARRGWITGLDDRKLFVRHQHAALNTLFQSAGAIIAKMWIVLFEEYMEEAGYIHSWDGDFAILAWIHDEIQAAVLEHLKKIAGELAVKAAADTGRILKFRLPVEAKYKADRTWAGTH